DSAYNSFHLPKNLIVSPLRPILYLSENAHEDPLQGYQKREVVSPKPGKAILSSGVFEYDYFGGGGV
ncbi:MAG TPA: hypothetical protein DCG87_03770, partial [Synergistaceae bacterium]|nr:hypothetical protein [Synergistaceae bacterium]